MKANILDIWFRNLGLSTIKTKEFKEAYSSCKSFEFAIIARLNLIILVSISILIGNSREGEEWSQRRSELNKVFLKSDVIDQYANVFNQIVSDVLDIWSTRLNRIDGDNILVDDLEKELYNWSIECKPTSET